MLESKEKIKTIKKYTGDVSSKINDLYTYLFYWPYFLVTMEIFGYVTRL